MVMVVMGDGFGMRGVTERGVFGVRYLGRLRECRSLLRSVSLLEESTEEFAAARGLWCCWRSL